jgi:hypothetical protein
MSVAKRMQDVTIVMVSAVAVVTSTLDLSGALDGVGWLRNRVPVLTLLVLGVVAAYAVVARSEAVGDQTEIMRSAIQQTVDSAQGMYVQQFASRAEFWRYAAERIRNSKSSIDDLTWGWRAASAMTAQDLAAYGEYRRAISIVSAGRGDNRTKIFREIMSFPDAYRIALAVPLMSTKYSNYHLRFYDFDHSGVPMLVQFYVFDKLEVLMSVPSGSGAALDSCYMTFKSRQLATIMSHFFETVWRDAIVLKDTRTAKTGVLEAIAARFTASEIKEMQPPMPSREWLLPEDH